MKLEKVYTVQKELEPKEFLRALLVKLGSHKDTPYDVCDAVFGQVKESTKEVIHCKAHVECDYTASIGYDRKEEYWDKEKKRDSNGDTYYVDVKKTRTVTDWHPHNGHIADNARALAFNENRNVKKAYSEHEWICEVIDSIKNESIKAGGSVELSYDGLQLAKHVSEQIVTSWIKYPGDHHRDVSKSSEVKIMALECYILPYYEVEFTYNGIKYRASGFACGKPNVECELPPNNVDFKEIVAKQAQPFKVAMVLCWVAIPMYFILALSGVFMITFASFFILVLLAIISTVLRIRIPRKKLEMLMAENRTQKMNNLVSALSKYRYASLTDEERKLF